MRQESGFTLVELMVVVAILGILAVTAVPFYQTWQQRAYGSEASVMMRKLVEGQITFFLENNKFFPADGSSLAVYQNDPPTKPEIDQITNALKLTIPVGHQLDYSIHTDNTPGAEWCQIQISAAFPLFKDGSRQLIYTLDKTGRVYEMQGG